MEMVSLYDYLGRAAGPDLGKQVATAAAKAGVKSEIREVSNIKYTGPIMLYPKSFLDLYFKGGLMKTLKENKYYLDNMWTTNTTYGDDIEVIYFITE